MHYEKGILGGVTDSKGGRYVAVEEEGWLVGGLGGIGGQCGFVNGLGGGGLLPDVM